MEWISIKDPVSLGYMQVLYLYTTDEYFYNKPFLDMSQTTVTYVNVNLPYPYHQKI